MSVRSARFFRIASFPVGTGGMMLSLVAGNGSAVTGDAELII